MPYKVKGSAVVKKAAGNFKPSRGKANELRASVMLRRKKK